MSHKENDKYLEHLREFYGKKIEKLQSQLKRAEEAPSLLESLKILTDYENNKH